MQIYDLFTGIGGLSSAIHTLFDNVTVPVCCEQNSNCIAIIKSKMHASIIHPDIRTLTKEVWKDVALPDFIVAGFPCKGFSSAGAKTGTDHVETGLVTELNRVISETKPSFVFLENVASILWKTHANHYRQIIQDIVDMGYAIRWMTLSAADVGAPHKRDRWFALCVRENPNPEIRMSKKRVDRFVQAKSHWMREPCPRLAPALKPGDRLRSAMLGNACIPQQATVALLSLWMAFDKAKIQSTQNSIHDFPLAEMNEFNKEHDLMHCTSCPRFGYVRAHSRVVKEVSRPKIVNIRPPEGFQFTFTIPLKLIDSTCDTEATYSYSKSTFNTPTATNSLYISSKLTRRSIRDFATQLSLESGTDRSNGWKHTNINYLEWIMGFDKDFTKHESPI